MAYVFVDNAQLCVDRIALRVRAGGHDIPKDLVRRRFSISMKHFWHVYRLFVDKWTLYYNGREGPTIVAVGRRDEYSVLRQSLFERFGEQVS